MLAAIQRRLAKHAIVRTQTFRLQSSCFAERRAGPCAAAKVAWVGHSLMQERAPSADGEWCLFDWMQRFCQQRELHYTAFDHTLYGSPLSLQWRGRPHSYAREAPEHEATRLALRESAADYDVFVLTEIVPLANVYHLEYSAHYLQQFYELVCAHPRPARVYLYESWDYLHGSRSESPPECFDWRQSMEHQRRLWESMADNACGGTAVGPGLGQQLTALLQGCCPRRGQGEPIWLVPVGQVLLALQTQLANRGAEGRFLWRSGETLQFSQLFTNAYRNWPGDWPLPAPLTDEERSRQMAALERHYPERELDDIHPSAVGIYLVALTHFATLFRQSPEGLPALADLAPATCAVLQSLVWEVVRQDPRSGVA